MDVKSTERGVNVFKINCLAPTQNPHFGPEKIVYVPHFLGKNAKKGPT